MFAPSLRKVEDEEMKYDCFQGSAKRSFECENKEPQPWAESRNLKEKEQSLEGAKEQG